MSINENNNLLEQLDKLARWTRIPQLNELTIRRRNLRFLPIAVLAIGTLGFAILLSNPKLYWWGYLAMMLNFMVAVIFPMLGPVKQVSKPEEQLDELDLMRRRNAYLFTFALISAVALLGIWLLVGLTVFGDWKREELLRAMLALFFYLLTLVSAMPTLYASWIFPVLAEDELAS